MQVLSTEILHSSASIRLDFDGTTLIILALFVVLHFVLKKLVFTPFLEDVDAREGRTTEVRQTCADMELKASELQARYEELSAEALSQAQEARRELRVDGLEQKESAVDSARKQANAHFDEGSSKLNAQFESARKEALSQVDALAREIKTKVLGA